MEKIRFDKNCIAVLLPRKNFRGETSLSVKCFFFHLDGKKFSFRFPWFVEAGRWNVFDRRFKCSFDVEVKMKFLTKAYDTCVQNKLYNESFGLSLK